MASYDPPNPYVPNTFNSSNFILPGTTITTKYLNENYLQFPFAQGTENFVSINNQGSLTQGGRAEFSSTTNPVIFTEPPTITNPVIYPATIPGDSLATITYVNDAVEGGSGGGGNVYTNLSNIYEVGTTQTFTNNSFSNAIEIFNTAGGFIYLSSGGSGGLNIYTSGTGQGSSSGISITNGLQQSTAIYPTTGGTQIVGALLVGGNITTTSEIKGSSIIGTGSMSSPTYYLKTDTANYGNLTGSNNGITSSVNMYVPAQTTYDSGTTYGNLASTQQFVQKAIESQGGGGDAYLGNIQTFTAQNTFTGGCNITNNATCGTTTVDIVNIPYGIVNNTMLTNYSPYQYSYISGTCSPNYDIVLATNPYIVASYQSTIQNFTNAASSATYNFICSRVNNVGTLTFNFIPSIPTSGNQQTINNMICITRTVPNNTFWTAGRPPSGFFNLTDMIVLAYFQVPVAYFNANAYNYVNQLFLQYDTGSGIEGQMVGVCIIPIIVVDVYYYIMAIIPNGAIHYTLPSIYSIYIPQISITIPVI